MHAPVERSDLIRVEDMKRGRGAPKIIWNYVVVRKSLIIQHVLESTALSRMEWWKKYI